MPYVAESSDVSSDLVDTYGGSFLTPAPGPKLPLRQKIRYQYGWRSRGEVEASYDNLRAWQNRATWSDTLSVLQALERVERALDSPIVRARRPLQTNRRDYTETSVVRDARPVVISLSGVPSYAVTPIIHVDASITQPFNEGNLRTAAGVMMRHSRPTSPQASLGQWLGELKQFPRLFSRGASGPLSSKDVGSAYLNKEFGWKPFISDLEKAADAIIKSQQYLEQLLRDSGKLVHRTRSRVLENNTHQSVAPLNLAGKTSGDMWLPWSAAAPVGPFSVNLGFTKGIGLSNFRSQSVATVTRKRTLKTYCLWEYFFADPHGAIQRILSAGQKAEHLLGLSLTPALVYELTPWTWLSDWFIDVGSLLSFQQDVSDYSLAARNSGFVYEDEVTLSHHAKFFYGTGAPTTDHFLRCGYATSNAFTTYKRQWRRKGTPYDMGISWDGFSLDQWFILGALGLAGGVGVPLA